MLSSSLTSARRVALRNPSIWRAPSVRHLSVGQTTTIPEFLSPTHAGFLDATLVDHLPIRRHTRVFGEILPAGYHLIFFNPQSNEASLSPDGYESYQAPDHNKYPNRMWLGGSVVFNPKSQLVLGVPSVCTETIGNVRELSGGRMLVTLERTMRNTTDLSASFAIKEERKLIYFGSDASANRSAKFEEVHHPDLTPDYSHSLTPTQTMLFRYSALTFNAHKIHYDDFYAKSEGFPNLVVHGPLTVSMIMRWSAIRIIPKAFESYENGVNIKSFEYKNLQPMFVDNELTLCAKRAGNELRVWILNHKGSKTFEGTIAVEPVPQGGRYTRVE